MENRKVTRNLPRASPHHIGVCYPTCSVAARNNVRQKTSHDAASPVICPPHGCTYQLLILAGNTQHGGLIGSFLFQSLSSFYFHESHHIMITNCSLGCFFQIRLLTFFLSFVFSMMIDCARLGDFASSQKAIILFKNVLLKVTWDGLEALYVQIWNKIHPQNERTNEPLRLANHARPAGPFGVSPPKVEEQPYDTIMITGMM